MICQNCKLQFGLDDSTEFYICKTCCDAGVLKDYRIVIGKKIKMKKEKIKNLWKIVIKGFKNNKFSNSEICNLEIYEHGKFIGIINGKKNVIELIIKNVREEGYKIDWHYIGGRGVVKAIGNIKKIRERLWFNFPTLNIEGLKNEN